MLRKNILYIHVQNIRLLSKREVVGCTVKIIKMNDILYNIYSFIFKMIHLYLY